MIKTKVICVGSIKEEYWKKAIAEYTKRISKYAKLEIVEVSESLLPNNPSDKLIDKAMEEEANRILSKVDKDDYLVTLEIEGKELSSIEFASEIQKISTYETSSFAFVIGGSNGLHDLIKAKSRWHLSFSKMTYPHQMMRVVLLEQIYRAFTINNNEPYHK